MQTKKQTQKALPLKISFAVFLIIIFSHLSLSQTHADTITNDNYSIDVQDMNADPQPTTKIQAPIKNEPTKSDFTTGPNYTVNASSDDLSFSLSQKSVDLGILSATNPVIRTSEITLSSSLTGAQVLGYENHPLLSSDNTIIPDSSCDNGVCTQTIAAIWQSTLTYGFGYRCDSLLADICDNQFSATNTYKQFSDDAKGESPQTIMISNKSGKDTKAKITYKVNISGTQKIGGYYNSVTYIAIPNF